MLNKRLYSILFLSLLSLIVLGFGTNRVTFAEESSTPTWAFETVVYEPISETIQGGCWATETTTHLWRFALPVTEGMLTELRYDEMGNPIYGLAFASLETVSEIDINGNGTISVDQTMHLGVRDSVTGQVTLLGTEQATIVHSASATLPHHDGLVVTFIPNDDLNAGDLLLLQAETEVTLQAEGCDPNGQPPTLSLQITKPVDPSSPILGWDFENCWP